MGIKWPWKKRKEPDLGVCIEYYRDSNSMAVYSNPDEMSREEIIAFLDLAIDSMETEELEELDGYEALNEFIGATKREATRPKLELVKK